MTKLLRVFLFALTFSIFLFTLPCYAKLLLIKKVNLIDVTGVPHISKVSVLISEGRIKKIVSSNELETIPDVVVVEAMGAFLIPGLWDMHVHWYEEDYLPLFIANGVTGVRQMWGMYQHYYWRKKENKPSFIGPKTIIGSVILDGVPKIWPGSIEVPDANLGRDYVRSFKNRGVDFIKVYDNLSRESYFAIADESKKLGLPFAGHVPKSLTVLEASNAGQKSIEHLTKLIEASSSTYLNIVEKYGGKENMPKTDLMIQKKIYQGYGGNLANELYSQFIKNETWQSPTLTVLRNYAYLRERSDLDKKRLTYLPRRITYRWHSKNHPKMKNRPEEEWAYAKNAFNHKQRIVGDMYRAGVKIIAGTDVLNPFCFPGFSLHDELELLVESGLSTMAALQAATINAVEFSGKSKDFGTIAVGKIADMVLLEANPLEDIRNTTKISAVILNGVFYDKQALAKMLTNMQQNSSGN
jgi:imidazolonepropionase-like amidohydrolase